MGLYSGTLGPNFLSVLQKVVQKGLAKKRAENMFKKKYRKKNRMEANKVQESVKKVIKISKKKVQGQYRKSMIFRGGSSAISVFPLQREHRNHFSTGCRKELKN